MKKGNKFIGVIALAFFAAFWVMRLFPDKYAPEQSSTKSFSEREARALIYGNTPLPDSASVIQEVCWNHLSSEYHHCISYGTPIPEVQRTRRHREKYDLDGEIRRSGVTERVDPWTFIYSSVYDNSLPQIRHIADSLAPIAEKYSKNRRQLAECLVSFVQSMPYWFILSERNCSHIENPQGSPCLDGVRFGLLSPTETGAIAAGDCDTKSLLLYGLLREYDFAPVIVVSDQYRHAMIALSISSVGDYLSHRGKKFYFWETTGKNWHLGMLPPDTKNPKYWRVALTYDV